MDDSLMPQTKHHTQYHTPGQHCFNMQFSPHQDGRLACVTGANYGLAGGGTLWILDYDPSLKSIPVLSSSHAWPEVLYDLAWSPSGWRGDDGGDLLITCDGDGRLCLWSATRHNGPLAATPTDCPRGHKREAVSVSWNTLNPEKILSASWDGTINIWRPDDLSLPTDTFPSHPSLVFQVHWSNCNAHHFVSASKDGTYLLHDSRCPFSVVACLRHKRSDGTASPVTCVRWGDQKEESTQIFSGDGDGLVREWDCRKVDKPLNVLAGHKEAVTNLRVQNVNGESRMLSSSYDCSVRSWTNGHSVTIRCYKEFVKGLDIGVFDDSLVSDCSWNQYISLYKLL